MVVAAICALAGAADVGHASLAATALEPATNMITVTTTADTVVADGKTSLREAIDAANIDGTGTTIAFNIPASDSGFNGETWVIRPLSELPNLQDNATTIDGFTQRLFAGNTNPVGPEIELDGSLQPDGSGITVGFAARHNTINHLIVHSFPGTGIQLGTSGANGHNAVQRSFVGVDHTGTIARGNGAQGVAMTGNGNSVSRSLISGNARTHTNAQILISEEPSGGNAVFLNFIGTDITGTRALVPTNPGTGYAVHRSGIALAATNGNLIARNLISGNATAITVGEQGAPATGTRIRDNTIGTTRSGDQPIAIVVRTAPGEPYETAGIIVAGDESTGNLIDNNTIAFTDLEGVLVSLDAAGNTLSRNLIFATTRLGIDLAAPGGCCGDGVTANDPDDTDAGPNGLQNFPVLERAINNPAQLLVKGHVPAATAGVLVEFFIPEAGGHASGHGGSMEFIGTAVTGKNGKFNARLRHVAAGVSVTATATDLHGNTSEFAANLAVRTVGKGSK